MTTWKAIPGTTGYEASDEGQIRHGGRLLRCGLSSHGYVRFNATVDGRKVMRYVHRCVALAFLGDPPAGMKEVCHGDGTRTNNRLTNLRWDTTEGNASDRSGHGTENKGTRNGRSKLTEDHVRQMVSMRSDGKTYEAIGQALGVSGAHAWSVLNGRFWSHLRHDAQQHADSAARTRAAKRDPNQQKIEGLA